MNYCFPIKSDFVIVTFFRKRRPFCIAFIEKKIIFLFF